MLNRLGSKAQALELPDKAREIEAQFSRSSFIKRVKSTLCIGLVVAGLVATVLWCVLIFGGLLWLLFGR